MLADAERSPLSPVTDLKRDPSAGGMTLKRALLKALF